MADHTPPLEGPKEVSALTKAMPQEIKVVSHSHLFYWWPVWLFGLIFALWTYVDNNRMVIVGPDSKVTRTKAADSREILTVQADSSSKRLLDREEGGDSIKSAEDPNTLSPMIRVSPRSWMGPVFFTILFLVILITNVPLRGLWSLVTIILIIVIALLLSLFEKWDTLLRAMGDLHIFLNMAGYLTFAVALLIAWFVSVYVFDRRAYMVFSPGQIKVCEEIGGREKVYDTTNLTLEKHRDDWFRHIILGFGTGDLTVKTAGADRQEIVLPNVTFVSFKIDAIEQMLRSRQQTKTA